MASLPSQRPPSQRRASPPAESSHETPQIQRTTSISVASVDSQTILLNSPPVQSAKPAKFTQTATHTSPSPPEADHEPATCWICFNDETEDDETTSEWRSPCPCVLVAHEKCLLDWIADMEAPSARRRAGANAGKILCPQCKSEIRLERPRSVVVEAVRLVERLGSSLLLPGFIFVAASATYTTLRLAGMHTIYQVFGARDAMIILSPLYRFPYRRVSSSPVLRVLQHMRANWRLDLGLPLIPTVLIASRTTVADSFLHFLPLVFFASGGASQDQLLNFAWPPSAAFTIAALPYVRSIYNTYYERIWLPREKQWLKEIQPRAGTEDAANADGQDQDANAEHVLDALADDDGEVGGDDVLEIEVDFDIFADWNNGGAADNHDAVENPPVPIARGPAHPLNAPPVDDDEAPALVDADDPQDRHQDAAPAPDVPHQPAQARRQRARRERNIGFTTTSLADTIIGALIFPSIAAAVGEVLKLALPRSWVTPPRYGKPTGFLQAKWARSIVGGCLFVGMKDVVLLYVRWKMAQNHRMRHVLDYDRSKGRKKAGSS